MYSSILSLDSFPINRTGNDFVQFNSYIKPSFDVMMNTTKYQFDSSFRTLLYQIQMEQVAVTVSQIAIFIFAAIFCIYKISSFRKKMEKIMEILIEISQADISSIMDYIDQVSTQFYRFQTQMWALTPEQTLRKL